MRLAFTALVVALSGAAACADAEEKGRVAPELAENRCEEIRVGLDTMDPSYDLDPLVLPGGITDQLLVDSTGLYLVWPAYRASNGGSAIVVSRLSSEIEHYVFDPYPPEGSMIRGGLSGAATDGNGSALVLVYWRRANDAWTGYDGLFRVSLETGQMEAIDPPWGEGSPVQVAWDGECFVVHWLESMGGGQVHATRLEPSGWVELPLSEYATYSTIEPVFSSATDPGSGRTAFFTYRNPLHLFVHDRLGSGEEPTSFSRSVSFEGVRLTGFAYPQVGIGYDRMALAARTSDQGTVLLEVGADGEWLGSPSWLDDEGVYGSVAWQSKAILVGEEATRVFLVDQTRIAEVTLGQDVLAPRTVLANENADCMRDNACTSSVAGLLIRSMTAIEFNDSIWLGFRDFSGSGPGIPPDETVPRPPRPPYRLLRLEGECTARSIADEYFAENPR